MDDVSKDGAVGSELDARAQASPCASVAPTRREPASRSEALLRLGRSLSETGSSNVRFPAASTTPPARLHHPAPSFRLLIGTKVELRFPVTYRKQRPDNRPNRYTSDELASAGHKRLPSASFAPHRSSLATGHFFSLEIS
jgi:hypothetical protein